MSTQMRVRLPRLKYLLEIKEEKLREFTDGLVRELKRTSLIMEFSKRLRGYMPKYNELKHFNPMKIANAFINDLNSAGKTTGGGLNTMTFY